jgi:S1-C subfamily serine protease
MKFSIFALGLASLVAVFASSAVANNLATPTAQEPVPTAVLPTPAASAPSSTAQKLYNSARQDLLQVRVLLKNGRSQSSIGSGFLIGNSNLVITNYHVISQIALEPETYFGEYLDPQGQRGSVELLAVDVLRDLAVVRVDRTGSGFFTLPEQPRELQQGQYLYSLGNPLDLGFAIAEGTYNGVIQRDFSDLLMFTGALNPGMSGGPNITADGQVAGVNVSHRLDGELVSFLVPARYVAALLKKVAEQEQAPEDFKVVIGEQLLEHQAVMVNKLLETPLSIKQLGEYQVPVRESDQVRCWGSADNKSRQTYSADRIQCAMESSVFISNELRTGHISINHTLMGSNELGAWRFAQVQQYAFSGQASKFRDHPNLSGPACHESFVSNGQLPMRAVICVSAYNKFADLFNFTLFLATTDNARMSLHSRLHLSGVSYDNGLHFSQTFIQAIAQEGEQ